MYLLVLLCTVTLKSYFQSCRCRRQLKLWSQQASPILWVALDLIYSRPAFHSLRSTSSWWYLVGATSVPRLLVGVFFVRVVRLLCTVLASPLSVQVTFAICVLQARVTTTCRSSLLACSTSSCCLRLFPCIFCRFLRRSFSWLSCPSLSLFYENSY